MITGSKSKKVKFLYEGNFSCVYHPNPLCQRKIDQIPHKSTDMIGKIIRPIDSVIEWANAKELHTIDPKQNYFIYPQELCEIIPKQTSIKCNLVKKDQRMNMLKIPYANHTLIQDCMRHKKKISLLEFIPKLYHLFKGIELLHKNDLIHQDIKINNVVSDKTRIRLIDFGISIHIKDVFDLEKNAVYINNDYPIHPPEYRYFSRYYYLQKKIETPALFIENEWYLQNYIVPENKLHNLDLYKIFYSFEQYTAKIQALFDQLKDYTKPQLQKVFTNYATKIDIYGLGVALLHVYPYIEIDKTTISKQYFTLIQNMINPNVFERYDTEQCLKTLQALIIFFPKKVAKQWDQNGNS